MAGKFYKLRVTDDSTGPGADGVTGVVPGHKDLEKAISSIFGIPDAVEIGNAIFGTVSNDEYETGRTHGVSADGEIWMLSYGTDTVLAYAGNGAGIEFNDGIEKRKLTFVNSNISLWAERDNGSWRLLIDYEAEAAEDVELKSLADVDGSIQNPPFNKVGYVVAQGSGENAKFKLVQNEVANSGAQSFLDLKDASSTLDGSGIIHFGHWGEGLLIDTSDPLKPIIKASPISEDNLFVMWAKRGNVQLVNSWQQITGWNIDTGGTSSGASITDNKFNLEKGLYKVSVQWIQVSADGAFGQVRMAFTGSGYEKFPSEPVHRQGISLYYQTLASGSVGGWWNEIWIEEDDELEGTGIDMGPIMIVVPVSGSIGVMMSSTISNVMVRPSVQITRIP